MISEYLGQCMSVEELADVGYAQSGYESILRFSTWKDQKCTEHSVTDHELVDRLSVDIETDSVVSVGRLREFVVALESAGIEDACVDTDGIESEWDSYRCTGNFVLSAHRTVTVAKTDGQYMYDYRKYVGLVHGRNVDVWDNEKIRRSAAAKAEQRRRDEADAELALYLKLRAKYEGKV